MKAWDVEGKPAWDVVDVTCDLAGLIAPGESVSSAEWIVAPESLTKVELDLDGTVAGVRIGGGVAGEMGELRCRAAFSDGTRQTVLIRIRVLP